MKKVSKYVLAILVGLHTTVRTVTLQEQPQLVSEQITYQPADLQTKSAPDWLTQLKNGIIPKGLEKTFALTAGALTGLPIIATDAVLKNDLSSNQLAGIKAVGALIAGYVTYKTHAILEQRNAEAIIKRTEELRTIATTLSNLILHAKTLNVSIAGLIEGDVTTGQLLKNMSGSDTLDLSIDFDIQIAYVLENIIKEARWLNQKLAILNHPTIDIRFIVAVYADLQRIYLSNHPEGGLDKKLKEYKQMLHDKKIGTKIKNGTWWSTRMAGKTIFYTGKYGIKTAVWCADKAFNLFLVVLHSALSKIPSI